MADIVTRLLLKTNDFDANLNKSKQSVNDFQGGITNMAKTAGAGIMKFAGVVGLAVGATEAFNKTINSTQTTGDDFVKKMDQAKGSVDSFFTSIAMGDLSVFLTNLGNVIQKSGHLSVVLDDLATKALFSDAELNNLITQKRIQENIAKDRSRSDGERNKALEKARTIQIDINKLQHGLAGANKTSAYATLDAGIAKQGLKGNVARSTWDFALKESNRDKITDYGNMYRSKLAQIDNSKEINMTTGMLMDTPESKRLKANFNKWVKGSNGQFAQFAYYFSEMDDSLESDIGKAISLINKSNSMIGSISDAELLLNNTDAKINGSYKSNDKGAGYKEEDPLAGSIALLDTELAKKNKELVNATTLQAKTAIQLAINELNEKRISLKIELDKSVFKELHGEMKGGDLGMAGIPKDGLGISKEAIAKMKLPKFESPIKEDDINKNKMFADSVGSIGYAFDSASQMAARFGSDGLSFALGSVGSIAQMIVSLQSLATAQGVASAFALPFPANLAAIATVIGTITSIFSSLPAFETGGIVGGSSFTGDNVLARVNSGEMILNQSQQANLFSMLNTRRERPTLGNMAQIVQPTEQKEVQISGNFKVKGSDLELALKNQTNKKSKIR